MTGPTITPTDHGQVTAATTTAVEPKFGFQKCKGINTRIKPIEMTLKIAAYVNLSENLNRIIKTKAERS